MNDVVLKTLFHFVKPCDLMVCRLVCKKWLVQSLSSARSTFATTIHGDFSWSHFAANHKYADFVKLFGSNCSGFPFTKFNLGSISTTRGPGKDCLQLFGEEAKEIDLFNDDIHFVENISALLKSVPNLEYFKYPTYLYSLHSAHLENINDDEYPVQAVKLFSGPESEIPALKFLKTLEIEKDLVHERHQVCPTFFEEFLSAAENISTILTAQCVPMSTTGLELLKILENLGRESRIKILSLTHVGAEHLDVLKTMVKKTDGLKLKHLSISQGINVPPNSWFEILDLLKGNLVSLQVHKNSRIPEHFPRMSELKLLDFRIEGNVPHSDLIFNGFNNSFPALQYLRLSSCHELELDEFYAGSESCPIMKSLHLGNFSLDIQTFERTLIVFPNLNELEMNITVDGANILQKIWTQMARLEKLIIYGELARANNVESLVTGISAGGIKKIEGKKLSITLKYMTTEVRRENISALISEYRTLPSIGNLTNLKDLTLNLTTDGLQLHISRYKLHLSDLTGYLGLYSMKNLRHLNISDCEISKSCCEQLVADMGLHSWTFQGAGGLDIIPPILNSDNNFDWDKFPSSKFSCN